MRDPFFIQFLLPDIIAAFEKNPLMNYPTAVTTFWSEHRQEVVEVDVLLPSCSDYGAECLIDCLFRIFRHLNLQRERLLPPWLYLSDHYVPR